MPAWFSLFLMFLKATPLEPVATQLEKDLADGKISVEEGIDLAIIATEKAQGYFPKQAPEIELVNDLAEAAKKFIAAKVAQKPAAA